MSTNSSGGRRAPYWGDDRRRALARPEGSPRRLLLTGGGLLVVVFLAINLVGGFATVRTGLDTLLLQMLLEAGAAALAVVVALLCMVRWRLVGEAAALWAGVGLLVLGSVTMAVTGLLPLVYDPAIEAVMWLRPASRLVAITLLAAAVASPAVDGRLRMSRLLFLASALTAALAVAFHLTPDVARHLTGRGDALHGVPGSGLGPWLIAVAWVVLAVGFMVRGHRESRPLLAWLGLLAAGFGLADLTRILASEGSTLWSAGAHLLRLGALGLGVAGATLELQRAFRQQGRDLMNSVVAAATTEARMRAERQEAEERAHEARNALAAIEGASQTLERHREYLDADARGSLVSALSAEISRLQRLVSAEELQEDRAVFKVGEALAPVITSARAQGAGILVDIDEDLTAFGRWSDTAEVLQNVVENARRYAPGSPVVIRARREDGRVLVRVEDRGPGVDPEQREAIFRRGVRGSASGDRAGSGLGLYVSTRLMRDQQGDLWLEDRAGGVGAVFVIVLPAEEAAADASVTAASGAVADRGDVGDGGGAALDKRDETGKVVEGDGFAAH